jgi:hypothetical protein
MKESQRILLTFFCPEGHRPEQSYDSTELQNDLDNGTVRYYCGVCDEFYVPNDDQKHDLRKRLESAVGQTT